MATRPDARLGLPALSGHESHHGRMELQPASLPASYFKTSLKARIAEARAWAAAGRKQVKM